MKSETFTFKIQPVTETTESGTVYPDTGYVYKWVPKGPVKAAVQIAHGMAETASRYSRLAETLTAEGYIVYANDHRGHGKSAATVENIGDLGNDGFNRMVMDMRTLQEIINKENPGVPVFLFGHSMGSFLAQRYICLYGKSIKGVILSGSNGNEGFMLDIGCWLAKREIKKIGRNGRAHTLNKLSFGAFNKPFKPNLTQFDWLSRDDKEVQKYIDNPYCGAVFTAGFFYDFFTGIKLAHNKEEIQKVPKELPIYIFSGDKDPVGKFGKGVMKLVAAYRRLEINHLSYTLYPNGRHEMLNEINRKEVMQDISNWLNLHVEE